MRKRFNGLCGLVTDKMHMDIMSGDVFIFLDKIKTHIKLLAWDGMDSLSTTNAWKRAVMSFVKNPLLLKEVWRSQTVNCNLSFKESP